MWIFITKNAGQCDAASASTALETANAFISLGLKDVGYTYVNIDDCWSTDERNSSGYLVPDPDKFPDGMKALADQIHDLGLKFGLYGCAGTLTCAGYPGSWGNEVKDAQTLASWDVDYWKHDACYTPCGSDTYPQTCWDSAYSTQDWYGTMRDALLSVSDVKTILFSMCQWGRDSVWTWGADYGNSWRMSGDIQNTWDSVASIAATAATISEYSAPSGFNDLDMMEIGNGVLTEDEERAHMGLWAIAKSPIILGTDLTTISTESLDIVKNQCVISINQDSLGEAATTFQPSGADAPVDGELYPYWAGALSDGVVIGLVATSGAETLSVNFADVPGLGDGTFSWTECYTGDSGSGTSVSFSLGEHGMAVVKVTT
ncbi:alpha-galactosidase [Xylariaceae sp. FL0016]|nr:alpha-galactosidase [Xylariaceae sp. FL0016]